MECQTCSHVFENIHDLHKHLETYQSLAQYHIRELSRCLAHACNEPPHERTNEHIESIDDLAETTNDPTEGTNDGNDIEDDSEEHSDDDGEAGQNGTEDLRSPLEGCGLKEFEKSKDLRGHYATHITCHEYCASCGRAFDRASTFLHHHCKKASGNPSEAVLRRRGVLRAKVNRNLKRARSTVGCEKQIPDIGDETIDRHRKRRKIEPQAASRTPTNRLVDSNDGFEAMSGIRLAPDSTAVSALPNVEEHAASSIFADSLTGISGPLDESHEVYHPENRSEVPALHLDPWLRSKAPIFCPDTEYRSKIPAMYSDTAVYSDMVFGPNVPAMYTHGGIGLNMSTTTYPDAILQSSSARYQGSSHM